VTTTDGVEVFRFDRVTSSATFAPGNYLVEIDGKKISFDARDGEELDIEPE
jgi:hypothetical protein